MSTRGDRNNIAAHSWLFCQFLNWAEIQEGGSTSAFFSACKKNTQPNKKVTLKYEHNEKCGNPLAGMESCSLPLQRLESKLFQTQIYNSAEVPLNLARPSFTQLSLPAVTGEGLH